MCVSVRKIRSNIVAVKFMRDAIISTLGGFGQMATWAPKG